MNKDPLESEQLAEGDRVERIVISISLQLYAQHMAGRVNRWLDRSKPKSLKMSGLGKGICCVHIPRQSHPENVGSRAPGVATVILLAERQLLGAAGVLWQSKPTLLRYEPSL